MAQREKGLQENHGGYNLALDIKNDDKSGTWLEQLNTILASLDRNLNDEIFESYNSLTIHRWTHLYSWVETLGTVKLTNKAQWPGPSPEPEPLNSKSKAPTISKGYTEKRLKISKWYIEQSNSRIPDEGLTLQLDQADILSL